MSQQTTKDVCSYFKYNKKNASYCYLEDGIQYQMSFNCLRQLKEFLSKHYHESLELPVNRFYQQLRKEDKNQVIITINRSYSVKM
jgi:hypothetical protein